MLIDFTPDELKALQSFLVAPLPAASPDEPSISEAIRSHRTREILYIAARKKIIAAAETA